MRSRTRVVSTLAMGAAIAMLASGCAIQQGDSAEDGVVTLDFWSYYQGGQATWLADQVEKFEADNPDIKVNIIETVGDQQDQKLLASVATGATPDLFINNIVVDFPTLAAGGVFADLTPYWEDYADAAEFPDAAVWKDGDTVYNLLPFTNLLGMYYNLDILSEYGITETPATLEELEEAMATVTADGKYRGLALSGAPDVEGAWLFAPQLLGEGVNYCNFEGAKVNSAFDRLQGWADAGYIPKAAATWDQNASWQQFMTGKYAFAFNGNWQLGNVRDASFEYGTAVYPAPDGGVSQVFPGGEGFAIGAKSEHPDEAWRFLEQMVLSPQAGESIFESAGSIPVRADVGESEALKSDPFVAPFVKAASDAGAWPNNENTATMQSTLGTQVSAVISGQTSGPDGAANAIKGIAEAREEGGGGC